MTKEEIIKAIRIEFDNKKAIKIKNDIQKAICELKKNKVNTNVYVLNISTNDVEILFNYIDQLKQDLEELEVLKKENESLKIGKNNTIKMLELMALYDNGSGEDILKTAELVSKLQLENEKQKEILDILKPRFEENDMTIQFKTLFRFVQEKEYETIKEWLNE